MAELKTKQTAGSVEVFLKSVTDEEKLRDSQALLQLMKQVTKEEPVLWGNGVIGYGTFHYKSERSKQEGDWFMTGFSPRKQNLTIYIIPGFKDHADLLKKLGKYKTSEGFGSCLYINKLADVDIKVLKELVTRAFKTMKEKYKKSK